MSDKLDRAFVLQREYIDMLVEHDKFPEYPVDLGTKPGQRFIKECTFNCIAELMEATVELKNKAHRLSDATDVDLTHYREEIGDAFAFFLELCIISGMSADDLYEEFRRKNAVVKRRLQEGY